MFAMPNLHDILERGRTVRRFQEEKVRISFIDEMRLHGWKGLFELVRFGVNFDSSYQTAFYCTYHSGSL